MIATLAVLLTALQAIGSSPHHSTRNQLLLLFSEAEEWGFIGTRRFLHDVTQFHCNNPLPSEKSSDGLPHCLDPIHINTLFTALRLEDIEAVLTIDQVGYAAVDAKGDSHYYWHTTEDTLCSSDSLNGSTCLIEMKDVTDSMAANLTSLIYSDVEDFPSTSIVPFTTFNHSLKASIFAGYEKEYIDHKHHSRFDNGDELTAESIAR